MAQANHASTPRRRGLQSAKCEKAPAEAQTPLNGTLGNDAKPKSFDYRHQHELDWGSIEVELANLRNGAKAVECMADADTAANGTDIVAALRFLGVGLEARIDRLKELLGLGEVHL